MIFHRSNFLSPKICSMAAVLAALGLVTAQCATAALIVNDTWQDGTDTDPASPTYSENGTDTDTDNDLESVWYQGGLGTLDPVGAGGPLRGNMTTGGTNSATWTTYFTPEASPVSLTNAGDQMRLTWVFRLSTVGANNTSQNFRFAAFDSPSASRISANGVPASAAYAGYAIFGNMGATLGNSNPFQLKERIVASGDVLSTGGNWGVNGVAGGLANGATSGNAGYVAGTDYTLTMTFTRTLANELQVDATMAGGTLNNTGTASLSVVDATPNSFVYDTFTIRPSGATTTAELFDTSLFRVEFNAVPEPASLALVAMGCLAVAVVRRRGQ
jgi:hypothetical protein